MACSATPYGLRYTGHCLPRAHAQQNGQALIPAGGKLGVTSSCTSKSGDIATGTPSASCFRMNAFCASENLDALIALRSSQPGRLRRKTPTQNNPVFWAQIALGQTLHQIEGASGGRSTSGLSARPTLRAPCLNQRRPSCRVIQDIAFWIQKAAQYSVVECDRHKEDSRSLCSRLRLL
jgi:hypothetical protein